MAGGGDGGGGGGGGGGAKVSEPQPHPSKDQLPNVSYCITSPPPWRECCLFRWICCFFVEVFHEFDILDLFGIYWFNFIYSVLFIVNCFGICFVAFFCVWVFLVESGFLRRSLLLVDTPF